MKKLLLTAMAACAMMFSITSCLENVEPAGIEELRKAKAELVRADAAYRTAEIQYLNAQTAYQEALNEGALLDNKLKELDIKREELENQAYADSIAYAKALYELKLAKEQAANEAAIAELEQDILDLELRKVQNELAILKVEQEKERLAISHQTKLAKLQKEFEEADAALAETLRDLEAKAGSLTKEEKARIEEYVTEINNARNHIIRLEVSLQNMQQSLLNYKFAFDSTATAFALQNEITLAERKVADANKDLEFAKSLDLNAEVGELEAKLKELQDEASSYFDRYFEIMEILGDVSLSEYDSDLLLTYSSSGERDSLKIYKDQVSELNKRVQEINDQITEYRTVTIPALSDEMNDRVDLSFEMSSNIAHLAYLAGLGNITSRNDGSVIVSDRFVWNNETWMAELPSGKLSWTASNEYNYDGDGYFTGLQDVINNLQGYLVSDFEIMDLKKELEVYEEFYDEDVKSYDEESAKLKEGQDKYTTAYNNFTSEKAKKGLEDALLAIEEFNKIMTTPTEEEIAELVKGLNLLPTIFKARRDLDNGWYNRAVRDTVILRTAAKLVDDILNTANFPIDLDDVYYEVDRYSNYFTAIAPERMVNGFTISYNSADVDKKEVPSGAEIWNKASNALYGKAYFDYNYALTPESLGYGTEWYYYSYYDESTDSWAVTYKILSRRTLDYVNSEYGYNLPGNSNYLFLSPTVLKTDINQFNLIINGQPELRTLIDELQAEFDRVDDIRASVLPETLVIYEKIRVLNEELLDIQDEIEEIQSEAKVAQQYFTALDNEVTMMIKRMEHLEEVAMALASHISFRLGEATEGEWDDSDVTEWIEELEDALAAAEEELRVAERNLEKLVAGAYDELQNIQDLELSIRQTEEEYNFWVEQFEMWSNMLKDYLSTLGGGSEEVPAA